MRRWPDMIAAGQSARRIAVDVAMHAVAGLVEAVVSAELRAFRLVRPCIRGDFMPLRSLWPRSVGGSQMQRAKQ